MIQEIYSKIDNKKLLHFIHRVSSSENIQRKDLVKSDNFIQCSFLKLNKNITFKPHRHIFKKRTYEKQIAQESWVVISGRVKCLFYDLDDSLIAEEILLPGDASFTLEGGHNYISLEDNTIVYEYKTGPYEGQENDKIFLNNKND